MSTDPLIEATTCGLTEEDIEYLRRPVKAVEYSARHHVSMDTLQKLIGSGKLRAVLCQDILWVQDSAIEVPDDVTSITNFFESLWQGNLGLAMSYWVKIKETRVELNPVLERRS